MARKRKFEGQEEWVVEAAATNVAKGLWTLDNLDQRNPSLAAAVRKWDRTITADRAKRTAYRLSFWDKDGVARVYVDGGELERETKVWFQAESDESKVNDWTICHSGDFATNNLSMFGGQKPWEKIALKALESYGFMPDEVTFSTLISLCRLS